MMAIAFLNHLKFWDEKSGLTIGINLQLILDY